MVTNYKEVPQMITYQVFGEAQTLESIGNGKCNTRD